MFNLDETVAGTMKYINKLLLLIETQADFTLFNKKYIKKVHIDDLLCCLEAGLPDKYKYSEPRKYLGMDLYRKIIVLIRQKALFSSEHYSVDYKSVISHIKQLASIIAKDLDKLCKES